MRLAKTRFIQFGPVLLLALLVVFSFRSVPVTRAGEPIRIGGTFGTPGVRFVWPDSALPIQYTTDGGVLGQDTNVATTTRVNNLFNEWTNVATSKISAANAGAISAANSAGCVTDGDVNTVVEFDCITANGFPGNPIIYDNDGSIHDDMFGTPNGVLGFASPLFQSDGTIVAARAALNGKFRDGLPNPTDSSDSEFEATILHEIGHYLGLGHSQINVNCLTNFPSCPSFSDDTFGLPTMFPISLGGLEESAGVAPERTLSIDDIAWISILYPEANFAAVFGNVSGTVLVTDGLSAIQGANVIARQVDDPATVGINESRRCAVSTVSGYRYSGNPGVGPLTDNLGNPFNPGGNQGSRMGSQYGLFEISLPGTGTMVATCNSGATIGMYTGEVEAINAGMNAFVDGSSVGPLGRRFPGGAGEQLPVPGAPFSPGGSITVTPGIPISSGVDFDLPGTPPSFDFIDGATFSNETPGTAAIVGNGTFRASISPTATAGDPAQTDVDVYSFGATMGTDVTIEIFSKRLMPSRPLDSVVEIVNAAGVRQTTCDSLFVVSFPPLVIDDYDGVFDDTCLNDDINPGVNRDSRIFFRPPSTGTFFVRVFDVRGDARVDFEYDIQVSGVTAATPDLTITKTHTDPFTQGQDGTYTITVSNVGAGASTGTITVTDVLPASLNFSMISAPSGWNCITPAMGANGTVTCTNAFSFDVGATSVILLTVNPSTNQTVTNTVTVAGGGDLSAGNNTANDMTNVNSPAGMFTFDGGPTGTGIAWNDSDNWDPMGIPSSNDDAVIPGAFAVTVSNAQQARSLTVSSTMPLTISGGGTLALGMASTISDGGLNLSGTLNGAGTVTISGPLNWSGGSMTGGGMTVVNSPINVTANVALDNRTITNNGIANMMGAAGMTFTNGATFINGPTGQFNASNDGTITNGAGSNVFTNNGQFIRNMGTGTFTVSVPFNNSGTGAVTVMSQTLDITGGGTSAGNWSVAAGSTLGLNGTHAISGLLNGDGEVEILGGTSTFTGTFDLNPATGTLNINGGTAIFSGTSQVTNIGALLRIQGGMVDFSSGEMIGVTTLNQTGGTLTGSDTVAVSGTTTWSGGSMTGTGMTNANGGLGITGGVQLDGRTLSSAGAGTMSGAGNLSIGNGGVFNNSGMFTIQNNGDLGGGIGGAETVNNSGTLTKSAGTASNISGAFTNTGTLNANFSSLDFTTFTQTAGSTTLNGGNISSSNPVNINGGTLSGTGTINASVSNGGGIVAPGVSPGTLTINGNYTQTAGTLTIELAGNGGVPGTDFDRLAVSGIATLGGTLTVNGLAFMPANGNSFQIMTFGSRVGDFTTVTNNANPALTLNTAPGATDYTISFQVMAGACTINAIASGDWASNATWDTNTVPTAADNVCIGGAFAVDVSTVGQAANSLTVTSTAPFTMSGGAGTLNLAAASSIGAGGFAMTNAGGVVLTGTGNLDVAGPFTFAAGTISGSGTLNANGGMPGIASVNNVTVSRPLNNAGVATYAGPGVIDIVGGVFTNLPAGMFNISGGFICGCGGFGTFTNQGTLTKSGGGQVRIVHPFTNTGTVNVNAGALDLERNSTSSGVYNVVTTLNLTGSTHDMNAGASITGAGTVNIPANTVNFNTGSSITTSLSTAGTVTFNAGSTANLASFTQTAGLTRLNGGNLGGGITFNFNGGTLAGTGTITGNVANNGANVAPGMTPGLLSVTGDYTQGMAGTLTIELAGNGGVPGTDFDRVNIGGMASLGGTLTVNGLAFMPANGNMFQIMTYGSVMGDFATKMNNANVALTMNTAANATDYVLAFGAAPVCDVTSAQSGDWDNTATWVGGVVPTGAQNVCVVGSHAVTVTFAQSANSLTVTSTAPFTIISGSSLSLAAASTIGAGGLNQSGGTLTGADTLTISGLFTWSGGTQDGGGITTANGGLNITGPPVGVALSGRTLNNNGAAVLSTTLNTGGVLTTTINNNGTFDIQADVLFLGSLGGTNIFNNPGTLTKSAGAGTARTFDSTFNNTGTVNANSGVLILRGGGTSTGMFNAVATLAFESPFNGTHTLTGTSSVTGAGTVRFSDGTTDIAGAYNVTGTTSIAGGTANFNAPASTNLLTFSGGAQGGTNTLTASGALTWGGGSLVGSGTTTVNGGGSITAGGALRQRTLNTAGTMTWSGGNFSVGSGAVWNNTGTLNITGNNSVTYDGSGATLTFNNTGTVTKSAGGGTSTIGVFFTNTGIVNANNGVLSFSTFGGAFTQTAGSTTLNGGNLGDLVSNVTFNFNGGTLSGVGTITGIVNNAAATVGPGLTPGTLTIAGNYFQGAGGSLNIELGGSTPGTQFDVLGITNFTTLLGTLNVTLINPFTPTLGNSFTIMTFASRTGTFTTTNLPALGGGNSLVVVHNATNVQLQVVGAASADLSVTKTDSADPFILGSGNLTYTVTVANAGASPAAGVVLTDTLPAGVTFVSATAPCTQAAGTVTCNLGTIASGANTVITIVVTPTAAGVLTNTANVTTTTTDPNAANNMATEMTTVNASANLSITKTDAPDPVVVNNNLTYTITVNNAGPSPATMLTMTDVMPANTTFQSLASPAGWTCMSPAVGANGTVTCTNPNLASGAAAAVFTLVVRPTAAGNLSNTATIASATPDPNNANNSATAMTTVNLVAPATDFSLAVSPIVASVMPGQSGTFTVTVGPIPVGSNFAAAVMLSCSSPTGSCTISPNSLTPGMNPANATMTVSTQELAASAVAPPGQSSLPALPTTFFIIGPWAMGLLLIFTGWFGRRYRRPRLALCHTMGLLLLIASFFITQAACRNDKQVVIGPYTVTVTGTSGAITHTTVAVLNVVK